MLENEQKSEEAEFHVNEVQYIQAEVCPMTHPYVCQSLLGRVCTCSCVCCSETAET